MSFLAPVFPATLGALWAEHLYFKSVFPDWYAVSEISHGLPKAFGLVILINIAASSFMMSSLGFKVGMARSKMIAKAEKDGDKHATARYSYPKMYAEGFDDNAKLFNCIQRGHQQALESYPTFLALSLTGGLKFPVVVACSGAVWMFARLKWAEGYATGNAAKRYDHWVSKGIWAVLVILLLASVGTALSLLGCF